MLKISAVIITDGAIVITHGFNAIVFHSLLLCFYWNCLVWLESVVNCLDLEQFGKCKVQCAESHLEVSSQHPVRICHLCHTSCSNFCSASGCITPASRYGNGKNNIEVERSHPQTLLFGCRWLQYFLEILSSFQSQRTRQTLFFLSNH